jgi:hypothetical protein
MTPEEFLRREGFRVTMEAAAFMGIPDGVVAAVHVYADESGKPSSPIVAFAGYVSTVDNWQRFDMQWKEKLEEWGIDSIHTSILMRQDLHYQNRTFADHEEKKQLIEECLSIANANAVIAFGVAVDCSAFRTISSKSQAALGGDGHMMAFLAFLHLLTGALDGAAKNPVEHRKASLIFDTNGEYAAPCLELFNRQRQNHPAWKEWLSSICFADDEEHSPLQAADILAWVLNQSLKSSAPRSQPSLSAEQLEQLVIIGTCKLAGAALIYDAPALHFLDAELGRGRRFEDIVRLEIKDETTANNQES